MTLGGRFDIFDQKSLDLTTNTSFTQSENRFSPRIGLVYQPIKPISLYASYAESFNPDRFSISADGSPLKPTTANQYEIGVKGEFFDRRLSTTLAAYQIERRIKPKTNPTYLYGCGRINVLVDK